MRKTHLVPVPGTGYILLDRQGGRQHLDERALWQVIYRYGALVSVSFDWPTIWRRWEPPCWGAVIHPENPQPIQFVLLDAEGAPLDPGRLIPPHLRHRKRDSSPSRMPGRHRRYYRAFRHPRTHNEQRANAGRLAEDGEPPIRGRRKHLVTAWDDIYRRKQHNWKRQRKTRWR